MIDLNLHEHRNKLKIKVVEGNKYIWDPIRKKHIIPQPEELVRQLLILHLTDTVGYPISRIQVEKSVKVLGQYRRYDIMVFDNEVKPFLLVECKSHKEKIDQAVVDQIARYNITLKAQYLLVTNGVSTYLCHIDESSRKTTFLDTFPSYPKAKK